MAEESIPLEIDDVTDDDRLWAALAWIPIWPIWPIAPIALLIIEGKKDRPFIKISRHTILVDGCHRYRFLDYLPRRTRTSGYVLLRLSRPIKANMLRFLA